MNSPPTHKKNRKCQTTDEIEGVCNKSSNTTGGVSPQQQECRTKTGGVCNKDTNTPASPRLYDSGRTTTRWNSLGGATAILICWTRESLQLQGRDAWRSVETCSPGADSIMRALTLYTSTRNMGPTPTTLARLAQGQPPTAGTRRMEER